MHSPAVVGAKYSSCSSSSWAEGANSTSSWSWCLALNKQGVFASLPRFFRARSGWMVQFVHVNREWLGKLTKNMAYFSTVNVTNKR